MRCIRGACAQAGARPRLEPPPRLTLHRCTGRPAPRLCKMPLASPALLACFATRIATRIATQKAPETPQIRGLAVHRRRPGRNVRQTPLTLAESPALPFLHLLVEEVARDGIEPPTRGFSIHSSTAPEPCKIKGCSAKVRFAIRIATYSVTGKNGLCERAGKARPLNYQAVVTNFFLTFQLQYTILDAISHYTVHFRK